MAIKAINNLAKLNGIIPMFYIVFRAYPRITKMDILLLSVIKRAKAIHIASKEVCCL